MSPARRDPKAWVDDTFRRIMMGFFFQDPKQIERTTGAPVSEEAREAMRKDAEKYLDPQIYVRALQRMGLQVLYHHAKSHNGVCCYATKVGHRFSLMGDRDFFGELVTACRKAGIVPGAMYQVGISRLQAAEHPDWQQQDATGKRCSRRLCPNNPAWRAMVMAQTEEIARYDIGAFMYDELSFFWHSIGTACYCPHCRAKFRDEVGDDLPETEDWGNPLWRRFVQWRYDNIVAFVQEGDAILRRVNPDIAHTSVYYGYPTNTWRHAWDTDRTASIYDYLLCDVKDAERVSYRARWYRALKPHRRPEINCMNIFPFGSYTHYHYFDRNVPKAREVFVADVMTALANGATPGFECMGWSNHEFWDKKKRTMCSPAYDKHYLEAAREIKRREAWCTRAEPIRYARLIHSRHTRDHRHHQHPGAEPYVECFYGWFQGLVDGQVLYEMGTEQHLSADGLSPYAAVVLPDIGCVSDDQAQAIREYVRAGGGLVASFSTSLFDEEGDQRDDFALADVLGVRYVGGADGDYSLRKTSPVAGDQYAMLLDAPHPFFKDLLAPGERATAPAPVVRVRAANGAEPAGRFAIQRQDRTQPFEGRDNERTGRGAFEETDHPVLVTNRFGKGRAVYLSTKFAAAYKILSHPIAHRLMLRAVRWAGGRQPVEVSAPPCIEVNAYHQAEQDRIVVHLVNYQAHPRRGKQTHPFVERILPVRDLTVDVRLPAGRRARKVLLAPEEAKLAWQGLGSGSRIRVAVPEIHIHGMVVVEHGPARGKTARRAARNA